MPIYRKGDDQFGLEKRAEQEANRPASKKPSPSFIAGYKNTAMKGPVSGDDMTLGKQARVLDDLVSGALADRAKKDK